MMEYHIKRSPNIQSKQEGATLIVTMFFLVLITMIAVSATKLSILDVLISGNDQQRVVAYSIAENSLTKHVQTNSLNEAFLADGFNNASDQFRTADSTAEQTKLITDLLEQYSCERNGLGSSIGGGAPPCRLYDFQIFLNQKNTGVRENHHRGGGKMIPQSGSKSSLL